MSNVFSSKYFPLIKVDRFQSKSLICASISIYSLKHSTAFIRPSIKTDPFPSTGNGKHSSKKAVDALTLKLSRICFN